MDNVICYMIIGQSSTPKGGIGYLQQPKRPTRHFASISIVGEARGNLFSFALEWISQQAPHHCIPELLSDVLPTL